MTSYILGIFTVACMGGALSILSSAWQSPKKVKIKKYKMHNVTPTVYQPWAIDESTGVVDMIPVEIKKVNRVV